MNNASAIELRGISKTFGSIKANQNVDLDIRRGEILSILGENGSGKTTLMNMIAGIYYPDEGKILIDGKEVTITSPKDAFKYKIGMIHQHFKLVDVFTAAENITLGMRDEKGVYNIKKINQKVLEMSKKYGFIIDPKKRIHEMSVSEKQTVEIFKVLFRGADILILDEPTAVLTPQEIRKLFDVLRKMREDGKSIVIITHKLNEVMEISDRVAVLRKGEHIATVNTSDTNEKELTEMMVGKKVDLNIERKDPVDPQPRLEIRNLTVLNKDGIKAINDISFDINGGEILGIAGIAGNGQKELLESIAGLVKKESGDIIFHNPKKNKPVTFFHKDLKKIKAMAAEGKFHYPNGERVDLKGKSNKEIVKLVNDEQILFYEDEIIDIKNKKPREIQELGIKLSFVPEDRLTMGLVGNMSIVDNMLLRSYRKGKSVFLNRKRPKDLADTIIRDLEVATPDDMTPVRRLSGGNVQKVLVGREISSSPKVLMAAYPVRGLDINSSYLIYNLLNKQKEKNVAVVFVGEDLDVLLALCDRILVLSGGIITGILEGKTAKKDEVGLLMLGNRTKETAEIADNKKSEEEVNG
ncbi:MAG: ABC transporter ATP-binding protein [Clostridia bacterium]|nr:ABC transporter ATP-binding protein [Clostridia bacterium]